MATGNPDFTNIIATLTEAAVVAVQDVILTDATPFAGGSVAGIKAKTDIIGASVALESGGNVAAIKARTDHLISSMDFWSIPDDEVSIGAAPATIALPSVMIAGLPSGATVVRVVAMVNIRQIRNSDIGNPNWLDGNTVPGTSQVFQVRKDTPGTWRDAMKFVDFQFYGQVGDSYYNGYSIVGTLDVSNEVDSDDTYEFQFLLSKANADHLFWFDVHTGLRVYFK